MSLFSKKSFDSSKCVSLVEVTQKRIEILTKKRAIIVKQSRFDVAKLLERGQDVDAAARAKHVFKEENIVSAYELLQGYCQIIIKGVRTIKSTKECSSELKEAIASLVYAAPRCGDLQELSKVRELIVTRFGAEFVSSILELQPGCGVNTQIIQKLSSSPPNSDERLRLLKDIAREYKIDWNYQRAVALSFNSGELLDKSKSPTNASVAPKVLSDTASSSSNHVETNSKEPTRRLPELVEPAKTLPPLAVSETSAKSIRHNHHASSPELSSAPSIVHDIHPKEREIIGVKRVSSADSPSTVNSSLHQDIPKEKAGLRQYNSSPSAMLKAEHTKKSSVGAETGLNSDRQGSDSPYMSRDHELRGYAAKYRASNTASDVQDLSKDPPPITNSLLHRGGSLEEVKRSSGGSGEGLGLTKGRSESHAVDASRTSQLRPKADLDHKSVSGTQMELDGRMKLAAASKPEVYHTKVSPKPEPRGFVTHRRDGSGVSLGERKYSGDHESHAEASIANIEEESGGTRSKVQPNRVHQNYVKANVKADQNVPQIKFQSNEGVVDPAAHNSSDAHLQSPMQSNFEMHRTGHHQPQYPKYTFQAANKEEGANKFEKEGHTIVQRKGENRMLGGPGVNMESKKGGEGQATIKQEILPEGRKHTWTAGPNARRAIPSFEPKSSKAEMDRELADLEMTVGSAVRAADLALEMVRTASMRSRANKKGLRQEELKPGTLNDYASGASKTWLEPREDLYTKVSQQNNIVNDDLHNGGLLKGRLASKELHQEQEPVSFDLHNGGLLKGRLASKELHQEQEPVSFDSYMPSFDDSSDDSSDVYPPTNRRESRLPLEEGGAPKEFQQASNRNLKSSTTPLWNKTFYDDDSSQSPDSFSPDSSSNSQQRWSADVFSRIPPSFETQHRGDADANNMFAWNAVAPARKAAQSAGAKNSSWQQAVGHDRASKMENENDSIGKGALRWHGSSEDSVDNKKWGRSDMQPLSQPYRQHASGATETSAGKVKGVSRRSVRSVGLQ